MITNYKNKLKLTYVGNDVYICDDLKDTLCYIEKILRVDYTFRTVKSADYFIFKGILYKMNADDKFIKQNIKTFLIKVLDLRGNNKDLNIDIDKIIQLFNLLISIREDLKQDDN